MTKDTKHFFSFLFFRFERIQIESPTLYVQCRGTSTKNLLKSAGTYRYPCPSSAQIYDYDKLGEAEYCDWQEVEFSVSLEFSVDGLFVSLTVYHTVLKRTYQL